jgi:hypothetical protein
LRKGWGIVCGKEGGTEGRSRREKKVVSLPTFLMISKYMKI